MASNLGLLTVRCESSDRPPTSLPSVASNAPGTTNSTGKIRCWQQPVERGSCDECTPQQAGPCSVATPGESGNLTHVPQIRAAPSSRRMDALAVFFQEIARYGLAILWRQKYAKNDVGPLRRHGGIHACPFFRSSSRTIRRIVSASTRSSDCPKCSRRASLIIVWYPRPAVSARSPERLGYLVVDVDRDAGLPSVTDHRTALALAEVVFLFHIGVSRSALPAR